MRLRDSWIRILVFLLSLHTLFSQQSILYDEIIISKISIEEKIECINSLFIENQKNNDSISIQNRYYTYIKWLFKNKQYKEIENFSSRYIDFFDVHEQQIIYYYAARSYYVQKKYNQSINFFEKLIAIDNESNIAGKAYSQIGRSYEKKGDYIHAIKRYKLAESILAKNNNFSSSIVNNINIAQAYEDLGTSEDLYRSQQYWLKADSLNNEFGDENKNFYIKLGLGESFNQNKSFDIKKAFRNFNKALEIAKKKPDSLLISTAYTHLGELFNTTDPNRAIDYQIESIKFNKIRDSIFLFDNYLNIGYANGIKRDFQTGIASLLKALTFLVKGNDTFLLTEEDLKIQLFSSYSDKSTVLWCLMDLETIYLKQYNENGNDIALDKAIKIFSIADQLIDLILIESQEFQSKLFWRKESSELYGKAIEACFLKGDAKRAFYFMEKNKALLLTENLKNQQLRQSLELPDSIIKNESDLKQSIFNLGQLGTTTKNKDSINIAIFNKEGDLKKLQDSIQQKFIDYKAIDLKMDVIKLKSLQNSLEDDLAILTYNISQYDDYELITPENRYTPIISDCNYGVKTLHPAYGLLITKDTINFFKLENSENLKNRVNELTSMMGAPFKRKSDINTYNKLAFDIYSSILPSTSLQAKIKNKKLRVIPDNYLHYLPFEALKTSRGNKANYWIEENEISYAFSNTFLDKITVENNNNANSFIGFAPINYDSLNLNPLQNSLEEINLVSSYFSGTTFFNKAATREKFLEKLSQYDIIHLATHANAEDNGSPWIAFQKQKLLQEELSLITNHAKMVVLSGCNTLLGKQEIGEGVMSLARGFFQSGAKSVVSSLWSVDDRSTSVIMNNFYKSLNQGKTKAKALQRAKLEYLKNHKLSEASPFYWASFVILGDISPLTSNVTWYYWLSILFVCTLLVLFIYRKFNKKLIISGR